ncbi:AIPR family protein [Amycolatopsis alkalitolerans]|uniref:AIPR family protein n=1 Tax=Amycolatopsis alkalitolerans TaxID=2547244 RepID=A0A5C4LT53_9PSEU|nr:AIPR family protein [Amycolatopsis alkalitolerans]TNC21778.1 AIPR family protein [Amycolatopsis alkalitolerans]
MDVVIKGLVREFQEVHGLGELAESEAFEAFAAYCSLSSFFDDEFNPDTFRMGGGNDLGIDAFGVVVNGELLRDAADVRAVVEAARKIDVDIVVVQAKTSPRFETKVVSDLAENLAHVAGLGELPYAASPDVQNLRECLAIVYENIGKLSGDLPRLFIRYVTTGTQLAEMVVQKAQTAQDLLAGLGRFEAVEFTCVRQQDLRTLYRRATTKATAVFAMPKKVFMPKVPEVEQALHGLLPAADLVRYVLTDGTGRLRKTLFHENVRDFQGYTGVNAEIRETLRDPVARERFAVFNNGITVVTRELRVVGDDVHLKDFQIVNGCQTCHVLFDERSCLTGAVHVTVRIVHTLDEDVISGIVSATNRQTVITEEDLSAREEFHRLLEDYFFHGRERPYRLYYERRSKQYSDRKDVEKTRVIGRAQLTRAYLAMFLDEPARVGHYKSLLDARGHELFTQGQQPAFYYTAAATWYRLEWLIRNRRIDKIYSPARYHLLAAAKLQLLGPGQVSHNPKTAERDCDGMLAVIWDANASEKLFSQLLVPLERAMEAEPDNVPRGEMVRTQRFADRFRTEVLAGQS